jgi:hypothetical protein
MGLFPEQIQQHGVFGSLLSGLSDMAKTRSQPPSLSPIEPTLPPGPAGPGPAAGPQASLGPPIRPVAPQAPPPLATPQPASPAPNVLPIVPPRQQPAQPGAIPGQTDPHQPGFDPKSVPFHDYHPEMGGGNPGITTSPNMGALPVPQQMAAAIPLAPPFNSAPPPVPMPQIAAGGPGGGGLAGLGGGSGLGGLLGSLFGGLA